MKREAGLVVAVLLVSGCNSEERALKKQAEWLCRYGQLDAPLLEAFPSDVKPESVVRREDLDFLKAEEGDLKGNPFGGMAAAMKATLAPMAAAVAEAQGKHTECSLGAVSVDGATARVTLTQKRPELLGGGLERIREVTSLATHAERVAKVEEWIEASSTRKESTVTLAFVKVQDGWRVNYDLKGKQELVKRKAALDEIAELQAKQAADAKARAELAKFEVSKARFYKYEGVLGPEPVIELAVRNGTAHAVSAVRMTGTLASPGRAVPWHKDTIAYAIPGGLEPGESATWKLSPNIFSDWGKVKGAPDMVFTVEVTELRGADGQPLATLEFDDAKQQRLKALLASVGAE